eukprot:TRINITY_DN14058_c0_g1_i1.p1 TRINITY_DN14058_c0_g1~~TRINITY_DN14058_c0_g1_i1.p1  ORF type:complete len:544 (-),score=106.88 TRINITY_DN14058_c0_g1_i1:300-1931(-)
MSLTASSSRKFLHVLPLLAASAFAKPLGKFLDVRPVDSHGPADLLADLEAMENITDFDHANMTTARTERLEVALLPLFKIASQDVNGRVDAKAARYLLHRLFASRHAWHLNGLDPAESSSSPSKVGAALYESGETFTLRQLARFAAAIETLVHAENIKRLQKVFDLYGYSRQEKFDDLAAAEVVESYMVHFVTIVLAADTPYEERFSYCQRIKEWDETKLFAEEVRRNVVEGWEGGQPLSLWNSCLKAVEEIGERYGRWQNKHCLAMKSNLMDLETPGTGRVPLSSFWGPLVQDPRWLFVETAPTLERLGALDSTHQSVVIPNYLYSSSNCMGGEKYYDVCCVSECESLLSEIESHINAPAASPERLAQLLATLPSSTLNAPRELPATLVQRLEDVAAQHQGVVVLHGRLFAQVLHHAYPHECPYPHVSSKPSIEESQRRSQRIQEAARVTVESVIAYTEAARNFTEIGFEASDELPWSDEEELFLQGLWLDEQARVGLSDVSFVVPIMGTLLAAGALCLRFKQPLWSALGLQGKGSGASYNV